MPPSLNRVKLKILLVSFNLPNVNLTCNLSAIQIRQSVKKLFKKSPRPFTTSTDGPSASDEGATSKPPCNLCLVSC